MKVGLLLHGTDHTPEKYSQALSLLDAMNQDKDNRFEVYYVVSNNHDDKINPIIELQPDGTVIDLTDDVVIGNNCLDYMIIITPYPPQPKPQFRKWDTKIIYKEYGTTGIDLGYKSIWSTDAVYKYADIIITDSYHNKDELKELLGVDKGIVGSPAYDYKFNYNRQEYNDGLKHILWTPHHSIYSNKTYDGIFGGRYSTFLTYRDFIPSLVKKYPIKLHIKLHPNFERRYKQYCRQNHLYNDYEEYIEKLRNISNIEIVEDGTDYYQLFMNSDAILNDSISFLQEYLPTLNPMLVLYDEGKAKYNEYGESLINKCYYRAYNETQIENFIKDIINNEDTKKVDRREVMYQYYIYPTKPNSESLLDIIYNKYKEDNRCERERTL